MPNAGSGTQTIRGQRQRLSRYSQRHKNSGKEEICERKGKAEGIAEGMAKGEKAAKVKIAANLLSLGVPMKTIMQASGLSEEEIKNYCCPVKLLQAVFYI